MTAWAATHFGFMGPSPDHVASTLADFYMKPIQCQNTKLRKINSVFSS